MANAIQAVATALDLFESVVIESEGNSDTEVERRFLLMMAADVYDCVSSLIKVSLAGNASTRVMLEELNYIRRKKGIIQ